MIYASFRHDLRSHYQHLRSRKFTQYLRRILALFTQSLRSRYAVITHVTQGLRKFTQYLRMIYALALAIQHLRSRYAVVTQSLRRTYAC
jgi:hypothetical protein